MGKIFWGIIFALFDYTISNGSVYIQCIPDFIGCLLIYLGLKDLSKQLQVNDGYFDKAAMLALPTTIYALALFILDYTGISYINVWISIVTSIVYMVLALIVLYWLLQGLIVVEERMNIVTDAYGMSRWWKYMAIFNILACLSQIMAFVQNNAMLGMLAYGCSFVIIICEICLLVRIHRAKKIIKAIG